MTGRGDEYVPIRRADLDALTQLLAGGHEHDERLAAQAREAGRREGRAEALSDSYSAGRDLGHDVGYGARPDAQPFVNGILDGLTAGTADRQEVAGQVLRDTMPDRSRPQRQVSERWAQHPAAAREPEPEREAG